MKLINEINTIKNLMNLKVLNEAAPGTWLDDIWKAGKSIFQKYLINKSSMDDFIRLGFNQQEFKALEKGILESPNGQLGTELKTSLNTAKNKLPVTATAEKMIIDTRIREIDNLIVQSKQAVSYGEIVNDLEQTINSFTTKDRLVIAKDRDLMSKVKKMKKLVDSLNTQSGRQLYEQISGKDVDDFIELAKNRYPNTWNKISAKYSKLGKWEKRGVVAFIVFVIYSCAKQKNCKSFYGFLDSCGKTIKNFVSGAGIELFDNGSEDDIIAPD